MEFTTTKEGKFVIECCNIFKEDGTYNIPATEWDLYEVIDGGLDDANCRRIDLCKFYKDMYFRVNYIE